MSADMQSIDSSKFVKNENPFTKSDTYAKLEYPEPPSFDLRGCALNMLFRPNRTEGHARNLTQPVSHSLYSAQTAICTHLFLVTIINPDKNIPEVPNESAEPFRIVQVSRSVTQEYAEMSDAPVSRYQVFGVVYATSSEASRGSSFLDVDMF